MNFLSIIIVGCLTTLGARFYGLRAAPENQTSGTALGSGLGAFFSSFSLLALSMVLGPVTSFGRGEWMFLLGTSVSLAVVCFGFSLLVSSSMTEFTENRVERTSLMTGVLASLGVWFLPLFIGFAVVARYALA